MAERTPGTRSACSGSYGQLVTSKSGMQKRVPASISRTMPSITPRTTICSMSPRAMPSTQMPATSRWQLRRGQSSRHASRMVYVLTPMETLCHNLKTEVNFFLYLSW